MSYDDRYDACYAAKLWNLLPAIYRAEDSTDWDAKGPLQELVERVGAQAAVVRRTIDRLWEDQSIESCDDWVIDYLGDLLATNLVASLDARGRRVDVFHTIKYRRRKGTVAVLEELATDITGWSARVVEFFHRLGRTRHGLDPAPGLPARSDRPEDADAIQLQQAQRLYGARTRTGAGGFADLRDVHGARLAGSAFDEYAYTADVRRGRDATGRHGIPRLGVFVWRLRSFLVRGATPVAAPVSAAPCRAHTFDPTGRRAPLFAGAVHRSGASWISPRPQDVPGPISTALLDAALADLYPPRNAAAGRNPSIAIYSQLGTDFVQLPAAARTPPRAKPQIVPEHGTFCPDPGVHPGPFLVDYHHGFSAELGAGAYERPEVDVADVPARLQDPAAAIAPGARDRVVLASSRTYRAVTDATITRVALRAGDQERPVVRPDPARAAWTLTGTGADATLVLDGLLISGGLDVVLAGSFDTVTLSCCTLDPGTWEPAPPPPGEPRWGLAIDERPLRRSRLRVQGNVRTLVIDRCVLGPIVVSGSVETVTIRESVIQAADPRPYYVLAPPAPDLALDVPVGEVALSRSTVLGRAALHRADVSECILHDVVTVDDTQHGCVRFSAYAEGSTLPRKYQSVARAPAAPLFASIEFGAPAYAQLLATVGPAIAEGAEDGSEMGAFWREQNAVKERSLLIKYQEYLPLGLEPVIVHVT